MVENAVIFSDKFAWKYSGLFTQNYWELQLVFKSTGYNSLFRQQKTVLAGFVEKKNWDMFCCKTEGKLAC